LRAFSPEIRPLFDRSGEVLERRVCPAEPHLCTREVVEQHALILIAP
jgi:hypothetical protein